MATDIIRFVLAVSQNGEIPQVKLDERAFLEIPAELMEQCKEIAIKNKLIDPDRLLREKANSINWYSLSDSELIENIDLYFVYKKANQYSISSLVDEEIEKHHFLLLRNLMKRDMRQCSYYLQKVIQDIEKTKGWFYDLDLVKFLVESGAQLKSVRSFHFGNIDIKEMIRPFDNPVRDYILSLPDAENPPDWDNWW